MNVQLYSTLEFNLKDAADSIIEAATANEKTSNVGYDLGSDQTAVFEIRQLDDETYYLKESLYSDNTLHVDEDTEGEYDYFTMVEYVTARLQTLDQVTDYPRMPESKQEAIAKAFALLGIEKYSASQARDRGGKFRETGAGGSTGGGKTPAAGGGGGGGGTGKAIPTTDSQKKIKIDESKLPPSNGKNRDILDRGGVLKVYAEKVKALDPSHTIGADGGAVYSGKLKVLAARPANYPKGQPFNPREQKVKEGDWITEYKPFATKTEMMGWMNEGDLGARKAQVALSELYSFASKRQGKGLDNAKYGDADTVKGDNPRSVNRFLEKNKLAGFDVDIHHKIPAAMGGSNNGKNLVALTPKEHAIAHVLEWSAARVYKKDGSVAKQGKWGGTQSTFEATGTNIKANNMYRALTLQTTAAKRSGNVAQYYKTLASTPSRKQAFFATQKAATKLYKMKLLPSDNLAKLKLDKSGRPVWATGSNKKDLITKIENNLAKEST